MNIILTGMMATGKTAVGKKIAEALNMDYIDTDEMIEKDVGKSIPEIFEKQGEKAFRKLEKKAVKCVAMLNDYVVSTGGGVVKDKENMNELEKNGLIICLRTSAEEIYRRTSKTSHRPLLNNPRPLEKIKKIMAEREKYYARCDLTVDTTGKKPSEPAQEIINFIRKTRQTPAFPFGDKKNAD